MGNHASLHILYDADCALCARTMKLLKKLDAFNRFDPVSSRECERISRNPGVRIPADLDQAMYVIAPDGRAWRGFFGFRRLLFDSPWLWPLLPIFYFPGASWAGPKVYSWVARNRRRLGCSGTLCPLPPQDKA